MHAQSLISHWRETREIIGIDNGDPACHEQWKETKGRHAFNGMAYAVIRAGQNKGELTADSNFIR